MKHFVLLALLVATAANIQRHKHGGTYSLHSLLNLELRKTNCLLNMVQTSDMWGK